LAEAGALGGGPRPLNRRGALWEAKGLARVRPAPLAVDGEERPAFRDLTWFETIAWDYRRAGPPAPGQPPSPLPGELRARGLPDARTLNAQPHGGRVRYAGLVICRQRPGTAAGVTFMTLEDETGFVNVVVWKQVFDRFAVTAKTETFLGVTGKLQAQDGVVHLVADELWSPRLPRRPEGAGSRDFH